MNSQTQAGIFCFHHLTLFTATSIIEKLVAYKCTHHCKTYMLQYSIENETEVMGLTKS